MPKHVWERLRGCSKWTYHSSWYIVHSTWRKTPIAADRWISYNTLASTVHFLSFLGRSGDRYGRIGSGKGLFWQKWWPPNPSQTQCCSLQNQREHTCLILLAAIIQWNKKDITAPCDMVHTLPPPSGEMLWVFDQSFGNLEVPILELTKKIILL